MAANKPEVGAPTPDRPTSNKRTSPDGSSPEPARLSGQKPEAEQQPSQYQECKLESAEQQQQQQEQQDPAKQEDTRLTNLIVNYLPQSMSQEEIRSLFSSIGEVESCKLIRDKSTINQSLGYGFVNYVKPEDAQRAIKSFNGLRLQNKTIKVSYARPSSESIKGANLYVSGLPKSLTQLELEQLFKPYGKIITSRILCDNLTGISKGVGFVRFDQRFEAERAIVHLNNTYVQVQTGGLVTVTRQPLQQPQANSVSSDNSPMAAAGPPEQASASTAAATIVSTSSSNTTTSGGQTPAPIIVKFANSPSSNPQKQMAAASSSSSSTSPGQHQQHHLLASLHPAAILAAGGVATAVAHSSSTTGPTQAPPPTSAAVSAYLQASGGLQAAVAAAASGNSRGAGRFGNHQPGPIYHYPATNRFRYSPMASELALATSSMVNPFAGHSQLEASHLANLVQSAGALTAGGRILPSLVASTLANNKSSSAATLAAAASCSSAGSGPNFIDSSTLNQHTHRLTASGHLQPTSGWCLFVYNLVPEVEESVIWKLFGPFGAVQQVNLVKDAQTNKCKGFAFVTMSDYNQALMAIQSLNGYTLANRVLQVSFKAASKMKKTG